MVTGLRGEAFKNFFPHVKLNPAAAAIKNANFEKNPSNEHSDRCQQQTQSDDNSSHDPLCQVSLKHSTSLQKSLTINDTHKIKM